MSTTYPPTFTRDDLLRDISADELSRTEDALATAPIASPNIPAIIAEQTAKVLQYTIRYTLADAHFRDLLRKLVIWEALCGAFPGGKVDQDNYRQRKYDEAMRELRDIRDGKFPDLDPASSTPTAGTAAAQGGEYGSRTPLASRFA